jgi:hypothetical protein
MLNNIKRQERLELARRLRTRRQFFHPTIAPLMFSLLLYFFFFLVGSILRIHYPEWLQNVLFLTITFSVGISGLIILKQGKFIERFGRISRGWHAYSIGILFILFGFGMALSGLYNIFFR